MADIYLKDIDKNELIEAIAERVVELLQVESLPSPIEIIYTRDEAAKYLNLTLPTLHKYTKQGKIKGHRLGRSVRYRLSDLKEALKEI